MPRYEDASDEELVAAFLSGDRDALDALVRRHESRVYGLAYRILGNRADALDAAQNVFMILLTKARSFKGKSSFTTWLYRLTVNACYDIGRAKARSPVPSEKAPLTAADAARSDSISATENRILVEQALSQISVDQRVALLLREVRGLPYEEIADILRVPAGTIKSRIARARAALAGVIGASEAGEPVPRPGRLTSEET